MRARKHAIDRTFPSHPFTLLRPRGGGAILALHKGDTLGLDEYCSNLTPISRGAVHRR